MHKPLLLLAVIVNLFMAAVSGSSGKGDGQVVKKLRYPEYDERGRLNFELMGDEATIRSDGLIRILNLVMVFYEEGKVVMRVTSPSCLFDRVNQTAVSTSTVCVTRAEITLTGRGFEWSGKGGGFKIHEEARVVLNTGQDPEGGDR